MCVVFNIQAQYTSFRFSFILSHFSCFRIEVFYLFLLLTFSLIFIVIVSVLITNKKWHCRVLNTARDLEVESVGVNLIPWCKSRFWVPSHLGNINNNKQQKYTHFDEWQLFTSIMFISMAILQCICCTNVRNWEYIYNNYKLCCFLKLAFSQYKLILWCGTFSIINFIIMFRIQIAISSS